MKTRLKIALLFGAVSIVAGAGFALAQMEGPQPPDGPMQGLMRSHGRLADRLLREFDINHDGKVSHDEMNRTIGARFAAAVCGVAGRLARNAPRPRPPAPRPRPAT